MDSFVDFKSIKSVVKKEENVVKKDFETIGVIGTWKKENVIFQLLDEGFTERIFIPDILEVINDFENKLTFKQGNENILNAIARSFF